MDTQNSTNEFLILDSSLKLRLLGFEENGDSQIRELVELKKWELDKRITNNIIKSIKNVPWSQTLLSQMCIISCHNWVKQEKDKAFDWIIKR